MMTQLAQLKTNPVHCKLTFEQDVVTAGRFLSASRTAAMQVRQSAKNTKKPYSTAIT